MYSLNEQSKETGNHPSNGRKFPYSYSPRRYKSRSKYMPNGTLKGK
jgi:hypothetical protein